MDPSGSKRLGPKGSPSNGAVLVTWLATRNDPYERVSSGGEFRQTSEGYVIGPTLTVLTDPTSPYVGRITDLVVLRQGGREALIHERVYEQLVAALSERELSPRLHPHVWNHDDPTDHAAIYAYLRELIPAVRRRFEGRELVVHLSPGTASMHTVWVLMAETGYISPPYTVVQSFRAQERRDGPSVRPLSLGLDTFFKRWRETRPVLGGHQDHARLWDPAQFQSREMKALYTEARRAARLKVPVLILGERGTGKTTLASWIRLHSPFRKADLDKAWPAVPCGQYTTETMRSELFGYVKGAFTGATSDHKGLLARATGDTLFLDEIGDVSRDLQRLLIKVLEDGTYQPVGSVDIARTDIRLVSATNLARDRLADVLDPDFLDRVSSFVLKVPPLREVPDELSWLWPAVLDEAARRSAAPLDYARLPPKHSARIVAALRRHPLPGNIRDLFRVAWRLLAARSDDDEAPTVDDAVTYALEALASSDSVYGGGYEARVLARAFADQAPLGADLVRQGPLDPEATLTEFKRWFAHSVGSLAKQLGQPEAELVRVSDRTLRNWRKEASEAAE